jgi:hypothetical protein
LRSWHPADDIEHLIYRIHTQPIHPMTWRSDVPPTATRPLIIPSAPEAP